MKSSTSSLVRMISGIVMAVLAIALIIYAAGAKLGTIENEIRGVKSRLTSIEETLEAINGRSLEAVAHLGDGITRGASVGDSVAVVGLLPAGSSDRADGACVLSSHGAKSD